MMPELSIGQIVHYRSYGTPKGEYLSESRAAIITYVHSEKSISLVIFNPTGIFFKEHIDFGNEPGQWSWGPHHEPSHASA